MENDILILTVWTNVCEFKNTNKYHLSLRGNIFFQIYFHYLKLPTKYVTTVIVLIHTRTKRKLCIVHVWPYVETTNLSILTFGFATERWGQIWSNRCSACVDMFHAHVLFWNHIYILFLCTCKTMFNVVNSSLNNS